MVGIKKECEGGSADMRVDVVEVPAHHIHPHLHRLGVGSLAVQREHLTEVRGAGTTVRAQVRDLLGTADGELVRVVKVVDEVWKQSQHVQSKPSRL